MSESLASPQIAVIGAGRLAWNLIPALQSAGYTVQQLISRNESQLTSFKQAYSLPHTSTSVSNLKAEIELVFLTVNDQAIASLAQEIQPFLASKTILVHTSGSTPMEALDVLGKVKGVFYPLQTFTFDAIAPFGSIPLFLEGSPEVLQVLRPLAETLSDKVFEMNSDDRKKLHMGAVFACNFTNLFYQIAAEQLPDTPDLDFSVYEPLVREQINKAFQFLPHNTQTGPAIRDDKQTMHLHESLLASQPDLQSIYQQLSKLILARKKEQKK